MKKHYLFIALAMVAAMTVSCKNNPKNGNEATDEVVDAAKVILSKEVLTTIDGFAQSYAEESEYFDIREIISSNITEEEKLVQPDYLLDPSEVNNYVYKYQKVNALAILVIERLVREVYGMPVDGADEAIARLMAELNHPITADDNKDLSAAEKVKRTYEQCKEKGELPYFWHFHFAIQNEVGYLISQNPDLFFDNITEEQWQSLYKKYQLALQAVRTLSEYDPEIKVIYDTYKAESFFKDDDSADIAATFSTIETSKKHYASRKEAYSARRVRMLE